MAQFGSPFDPYCGANGRGFRISARNEIDDDLRAMAGYAQDLGVSAWRYTDGKIALKSRRFAEAFRGRDVPLVFGAEGGSVREAAMQATAFLKDNADSLAMQGRIRDTIRQGMAAKAMAPIEVKSLSDIPGIGRIMDAQRQSAGYADAGRYLSGSKLFTDHPQAGAALLAIENQLASFGDEGKELAGRFRRNREFQAQATGEALTRVRDALDTLTPAEVGGFIDYVEKGWLGPGMRADVMDAAHRAITKGGVMDELYDTAKAVGVDVQPKVVANPDLNPTGEYVPHIFDHAFTKDKRLTEKLVAQTQAALSQKGIVVDKVGAMQILEKQGIGTARDLLIRRLQAAAEKSGNSITRSEAVDLITGVISRNTERIAHNLESGRLNVDGYIRDPYRAYAAAVPKAVKRIGEREFFGPKDRHIHELIDAIERGDGGQAGADFARQAYHLEVGRDRVFLEPLLRELHNWQAAKLTLAVIGNMSQSLNTVTSAGVTPFVKAAGEAMAEGPRAAGALVERTGAVPTRMFRRGSGELQVIGETLDDIQSNGLRPLFGSEPLGTEASMAAKALSGFRRGVTKTALMAFNGVESYINRNLAVRTGRHYFDQMARELLAKGEAGVAGDTLLRRRMHEFDLDPEKVLDVLRTGDHERIATLRDLTGLRLSNATQFRSDPLSMPLFANTSALGKFFYQFKTFPLNQVRWFAHEMGYVVHPKRDPVRAFRALLMLTTAFPAAGIAMTRLRSDLMGPTLASDKIDELLDDPSIGHVAAAGIMGMAMSGALGIVADIAMTAAVGNTFAQRSFAIAPGASSILNGLDIMGSAGRAVFNAATDGDYEPAYHQFRAAVSHEFGGIGGVAEHVLRGREGREEPSALLQGRFQDFLRSR